MIFDKFIAALAIGVAAASASAQPEVAVDNSTVSKVKTVYVREARGLYIEKALVRKVTGKEVWVDARAATELAAAPVGELFKVPADIAIERGDLVTTRVGDPTARAWNLIPEESRVTLLVARHDTLMAMSFGLTGSQPAPGLAVVAHVCYAPTQVASAGEFPR